MNANIFPHQEEVRRSNILLVAMISPYIWKYISQWIMRRLRRWWESDSLPAGKNLKDLLWSLQARFVLCPFLKKNCKRNNWKKYCRPWYPNLSKGLEILANLLIHTLNQKISLSPLLIWLDFILQHGISKNILLSKFKRIKKSGNYPLWQEYMGRVLEPCAHIYSITTFKTRLSDSN